MELKRGGIDLLKLLECRIFEGIGCCIRVFEEGGRNRMWAETASGDRIVAIILKL